MKNLSAKYLVGALFAGLCVFAGCGEDAANVFPVAPTNVVSSSSAAQPQSEPAESSSSENVASNPASSSSVVDSGIPASSSDVIGLSSSSAGTALVNGPFTFATTPGALALGLRVH